MKDCKFNFLGFLLLFLWSCAPTTRITASWVAEDSPQKQYTNLFIAALSQNLQARQTIETEFSERLANRNVQTQKSINTLRPEFLDEGEPTKEKIMEIINQTNSEGILTVTLIDVDEQERFVPGGPMGPAFMPMGRFGYYGTFPGYFNHWYGAAWNTGYYAQDREYFLETNLYDTETMQLVWSAQSKTINPRDINSFAREHVNVIKRELRREGLIG